MNSTPHTTRVCFPLNTPPGARCGGRRRALLIAPALSVMLLVAPGCSKTPKDPKAPAASVQGAKVLLPEDAPQRRSLTIETATERRVSVTHLTGRLVWNEEATVRVFSPVAGRVTAVDCGLGEKVEPGAILARISSPDFAQAQADALKAKADLLLAERNARRLHDLLEHGAAAQKDVEAAEDALATAQAEKERAAARLALYGGTAEALNGLFPLRAPIAGTLVERNVNPGQEVRPDQMLGNTPQIFSPLLTLSDPAHLWVLVDATEADMTLLKPGLEIHLHARPYGERVFPGRLEVIGDALDPTTRTVRVRGIVPNPDRLLKAEMYVTVDIATDVPPTVEVPSKAVFFKDNRAYAFIEEDGQFARRELKTGSENDDKVAVLEGIRPTERVVTEGCLLLETLLESRGSL